MRSLCNSLRDPSLHLLLAIALMVVYLAFGRGPSSGNFRAEEPLPICKVCHRQYLPWVGCDYHRTDVIAHASSSTAGERN